MTPRFAMVILTGGFLAVWPLVEGCSRSNHATYQGNAPALQRDAPLRSRGGTNPNAPYLVASATPQLVQRAAAVSPSTVDPCDSSNLAITEIAAAVNGKYRAMKLAFNNQGSQPCKLGGYPAIALLDRNDQPVASVVVDRVTVSTLIARLTQEPLPASDTTPSDADVTLLPQGEAWFQVGWSTGENCPVIARISVSAPGSTETFTVNHPLTVCEGRVQITTLHSDQLTN